MPVRVIIAEDEWLIAAQMRSELVTRGYEVVAIAKTGTQALDLCFQHRPDLVLMDVRMPDMDGLVATSRIMSSCPTCVIIVSGNPNLGSEAERAGAMGYIVKPLAADEFVRVVEAARARFARLMVAQDKHGGKEEPSPS